MNALEWAAASDANLRVWTVASIVSVLLVGLAWTLRLIARERHRPAAPVRGAAPVPADAPDRAVYRSEVTRDLTASAPDTSGEVRAWRIQSSPQRSGVARHRADGDTPDDREPRAPSRLAALLGGLALRMGGRRRPVRRVEPTPDPGTAADGVPDVKTTGVHALDSPTRPLPVNGAYRGVTATGRVPMPPPWRPAADPGAVVAAVFANAGVPVDALSAALTRGEELRRWNASRANDPEATALLHRIGPDDGEMATGRWPR